MRLSSQSVPACQDFDHLLSVHCSCEFGLPFQVLTDSVRLFLAVATHVKIVDVSIPNFLWDTRFTDFNLFLTSLTQHVVLLCWLHTGDWKCRCLRVTGRKHRQLRLFHSPEYYSGVSYTWRYSEGTKSFPSCILLYIILSHRPP